jgi:hypothetical protein
VKALLRFGVCGCLEGGPGYAGVGRGFGLESIKSIISILLAVTRSGVSKGNDVGVFVRPSLFTAPFHKGFILDLVF